MTEKSVTFCISSILTNDQKFDTIISVLWNRALPKRVGGIPPNFGGDASVHPQQEGGDAMVTWEALFAFCMVIIAVIVFGKL